MSSSKSIVEAVLEQMPQHAESYLTETTSRGFVLSIHWKLNNDPQRPNKYSKTIVVFIARELVEDFDIYPESMQSSALAKIKDYISSKLKAFDPEHNCPRGTPEPIEEWTISINNLFG